MNFFQQQELARRNSKYLLLLFIVAVIMIIGLSNLLIAATLWFFNQQAPLSLQQLFSTSQVLIVSLLMSGVIGCAIAYKWYQLRDGGRRLAESLGGQVLLTNTEQAEQRQILNVVEEMAIASGMPVPPVYLLKDELGINAFAAGHTPADAVIGITQGALEQLNRDQLQGVVAHEFSHILNGDMRLNMQLIALLSGIVFISNIGEFVLYSQRHRAYSRSSRRNNDGRVAALGLGLLVLGWLGVFFANMIKAAISRQREYLADASAVQFTRNPKGIADALKIIAGYEAGSGLRSPLSQEASHMFIGNARRLGSFFASHPPLDERIKRLQPSWDGQVIKRQIKHRAQPVYARAYQASEPSREQQQSTFLAAAAAGAALASDSPSSTASFSLSNNASTVAQELAQLPQGLLTLAHEPSGAVNVVYALLLSEQAELRQQQLALIQAPAQQTVDLNEIKQAWQWLATLDRSYRLPLLELSFPALKQLSKPQYQNLMENLRKLIKADQQVDRYEWCLYHLVKHYLAAQFETLAHSKALYSSIPEIAQHFNIVLSSLAYAGHDDDSKIQRAFGIGANSIGLYTLRQLPKAQCQVEHFGPAVKQLANAHPPIKQRVLRALAACVSLDKQLTVAEYEMIRCIAAVMDCPSPQLKMEIAPDH
ncbi:M48 family metallopeptidase [Agarivorans sp.]|uniref:M48 family metallopeptidase n=1 Tax=Agarivorans sp. TaxID=1872412 RepID=UPI003D089BD2